MPTSVLRHGLGRIPAAAQPFVRPEPTYERTYISTATALYNLENISATTSASTAWPSANLAVYTPFIVTEPFLAYQLHWFNGTVVGTNNVDCALYAEDFTRIIAAGATLSASASSLQSVDITDTFLTPGRYYIGLSVNGTTATIRCYVPTVILMRTLGVAQQASAHVLPNPMVPAIPTFAVVPVCGIQGTSAY